MATRDGLLQRLARGLREWAGRWAGGLVGRDRPRAVRKVPSALPPAPPIALQFAACTTVVIPALNEARRIASVVAHALADRATAEVLVIDDSSIDETAALARAAGARVVLSTMLGKGPSMSDGTREARGEIVAFLDGDLAGLQPNLITRLVAPILRGEADFVKARFGRSGGRVTELTAKPMLKVFFPELSQFGQPLGGIVAARRSLLQQLPFEDGYGVDIGLLVDAHRAGARLAEVDIGPLENDSQPLQDLTVMANEVSRVIYSRARAAGRLHVEQIVAMYESQRQAAASIESIFERRRGRDRLLLLDMDGTLTQSRFVVELAIASGQENALAKLLHDGGAAGGNDGDDAATRSERIAALFRFVHRQQFENVARAAVLRPGAIAFVNRMRRAGFMVGVLSDSWFLAAEIIRKRVFADFALAHLIQFDGDSCNGQLKLNPAFRPVDANGGPESALPVDKSHVLARFRAEVPEGLECWAVGDNLNDLHLLRAADRGFAIDPKSPLLAGVPKVQVIASFDELMALAPSVAAEAEGPVAAIEDVRM